MIGLALSVYLELHVTIGAASEPRHVPLNCTVTYEGEGASEVDLDADRNLLTRTALYVLRCHGHDSFPVGTHVHIINPIPLGRGLGSSGAAVVAGVILANEVGELGLAKPRLLDYCLMIERHPDNVAAALYGGFVGTYLNELDSADMARKEIPLSEVLPAPAGGVNTGLKPPVPPLGIGHYIKFRWAPEIKAVAIIPDFEVPTAKAREVLPKSYSIKDVVSSDHHTSSYCDQIRKGRTLLTAKGLQSPTTCLAHYCLGPITARSEPHLSSYAGQSPSAVPQDPHSGSYRDPSLRNARDPSRAIGNMFIRSRAYDTGARD